MIRPLGTVVLAFVSATLVVSADTSRSEPLALELASAMQQPKLDAFAAKNPDSANGFVAVLLFPNVQMLVVAGEPCRLH